MANEGESYLDELLNTVAPDWEDTPISPENMLEDFDEDLEEEVSLEDALAILNDLPDSEMLYGDGAEDGDQWDGVDELAGLSDFGDAPEEVTDFGDMPSVEETPATEPEPEPEEQPDAEEVPASEETGGEEVSDIPLDLDAIMPEDELSDELDTSDSLEVDASVPDIPDMDIPVFDDAPVPSEPESDSKEQASSDSVDVDDIFQDALSAVGYSGNDDEDDEDFLSVDPVGGFMEEGAEETEGISTVPPLNPLEEEKTEPKKREKKGPGFFARIFGNVVTDQTAAQEEQERQEEQAAKEKKAAEKEEKKKQAEASKEEKAQLALEAKERKKQLKAEQAAKKAEEKEEKKRLKEERKAEEAAQEVVGKINPVGAAIVVIFFATIGILTVFGSMILNRNTSLKNAENYFAAGEYMKAYDAIRMVDVEEENDVLYRRIRMCTEMQKEVNSYVNYSSMNMRLEALDSLVKGIRYYDLNRPDADSLGIANQVDQLEEQLAAGLSGDFGIDADEARELLKLSDQSEYTRQLEEIVNRMPAA